MTDHLVTRKSGQLAERLRRVLPGGDTRSTTFYEPYPLALARGRGCWVWDLDGNEYLDFMNNFTSLVHGHAHPAIIEALIEQTHLGTAFPGPHATQAELAERITERVHSIELLRYTNSGSESIMLAVRVARALTGRDLIVKADGGYHGSWEQVPMSRGTGIGSHAGTPQAVSELIKWCEFNDTDSLETAMEEVGEQVAAIVLEPVQAAGGVIEGKPEFFSSARELANRYGALLVLDEVVTLRLAHGGYQSVLGVEPDLTALGKIIGGGLAAGAVGGRGELMEQLDPRRPNFIGHSGTFNGNPLTAAAGCVSLDLLDTVAIERINALGSRFAEGLRALFEGTGIEGQVTQCGSLLQIHLEVAGPVHSFRDINPGSAFLKRLHRAALEQGIFFAGRGLICISTPMDETVIDEALEAMAKAVATVSSPTLLEAT